MIYNIGGQLDLQTIIGNTLLSKTLFWLSVSGSVSLLFVTFFAVLYHKFIYNRFMHPKYNKDYHPKCSIILPCKGIPANFERNIESFLKLNYDNYEVIYTVESQEDPALEPIKKLVESNDKASYVVAGYSSTCSQKNYNMIKAVEIADNPDVYIFADSDIELSPTWVEDLVTPLSKDDITVVSGFRWLYSANGKVGELANVYQNIIIYILFTFASFTQNIGLWGGSMAMRKKDFEDMGVEEYWNQTVVDDMSLSALIMRLKKKAVMSSKCLIPTDDALPTLKTSTNWFVRQMMFLKGYQKLQWIVAILLSLSLFGFYLWLPISAIIARKSAYSFSDLGGFSVLALAIAIPFTALAYPIMGKHPYFFRSILFQPISLFSIAWGILKTAFTNTVLWSGITYKLNKKGIVTSVER